MNEEEIFQIAADLPLADRAAYLATACEGEPVLRERIERLLASHDDGGFMQRPSDRDDSAELQAELARLKPEGGEDRIGNFKLLQKLGEGGFGTVWMAEQLEPVRRRVALKIIKPGMDTKEVLVRFEQERQALALMDHPNIAKVLDAGVTPLGRPFFVMELVQGIRITDFCDQNDLSTRERLALFIAVCNAIQHAHQKGIIHRDIKPSNILVTLHDGVPVPKVIDFGVAKAIQSQRLTDLTFFTQFEQLIGTPLYMSPEQAEMSGLDIDTRSDIYSLGVLLYELLTGTTPFDAKELMALGIDAMRKTIRETEPVRPSTKLSQTLVAAGARRLSSESEILPQGGTNTGIDGTSSRRLLRIKETIALLRGDLDWIVMKCLEKDRSRRYATANGLAADLKRHLNNEPVIARPPSAAYKLQKAWRRNKLAYAAAGAVIAALILGLGVSTWALFKEKEARQTAVAAQNEQVRLRQEADADRKRAQTEAAKSQQVAQFLKDMLAGVGPSVALGRDTKLLRDILDQTAGRLGDDLSGQPEVEADLRNTIGEIYFAIGEYDNAVEMAQAALAIERTLYGGAHPTIARSLNNLVLALQLAGKRGAAEPVAVEALEVQRQVFGNAHAEVATALHNLASVLHARGHPVRAEMLYREALAMRQKLLGNEDLSVAASLAGLASSLRSQGKLADAVSMNRDALAIRQMRLDDDHPHIADSLHSLAIVLASTGNLDEAETMQRTALEMRRKLLGNFHPEVVRCLWNLAGVLQRQGKLGEIEALFNHEIQNSPKPYPNNPALRPDPIYGLLDVLLTRHEISQAEKLVTELLTPAIENQPRSLGLLLNRAMFFARRGQWEAAATDFSCAIEMDSSDLSSWRLLAVLLAQGAEPEAYARHRERMLAAFGETKDPTLAERTAKASLLLPVAGADLEVAAKLADLAVTAGAGGGYFPYYDLAKGLAEYRQGQYESAKRWLEKSLASGWIDANLVSADRAVLAMTRHRLNQFVEARLDLAKAVEVARTGWPDLASGDLGDNWYDWIFTQILIREATALIEVNQEVEESSRNEATLRQQAEAREKLVKAQVLCDQLKFDEAEEIVSLIPAPALLAERRDAAIVFRALTDFHARHLRWKEALPHATRAVECEPTEAINYVSHLALLVADGDVENYRLYSREFLDQFRQPDNTLNGARIAIACLILPSSEANLPLVDQWAEGALSTAAARNDLYLAYYQFAKGLAEYRQGRFGNTADWMRKSIDDPYYADGHMRYVQSYMVLAMAQQQLNEHEEARAAFAKGLAIEEEKLPQLDSGDLGPGWYWRDWIIAHALINEAKALLDGQPAGSTKPVPDPSMER